MTQVTAPIAASVGESVDLAAAAARLVPQRPARTLSRGRLVVIAVLVLLSVLAATGHLWVHIA